ncbi:formate dehydrogenase accessory sulfurtransferase FdhD [Cystobacter ferrugineus]|uniref:formate dehydrogenase accessory sulfurtransferase FdhD n=1 Tax=Cystobacter ferrugineus TaxID=83449 RepID=UPI0009036841|nr:formate dehydrogenase accessory sulfurtransferase FdhD [Cystobacter ferrugineus]
MTPTAVSIIGWSGAGKTTLITRLVPELRARGLRVGVVKHTSHPHPLHPEGRDTALHAQAGAALVAFATPQGVQVSLPSPPARLSALLERFAGHVDLVLVEGWKDGPLPKLEVWREGLEAPLSATRSDVLAFVGPEGSPGVGAGSTMEGRPRFEPEDMRGISDFLQRGLREGGWRPAAPSRPEAPTPGRAGPTVLPPGVTWRPVRRHTADDGLSPERDDAVAIEEPLDIRVSGDTVAVTLRTPGADRFLVTGFLFAEGLIHGAEDLGGLVHCGRPGEEGYGNTVEVTPAPGLVLDLERVSATRRGTLTTAACGVCGRRSVDDLVAACHPVPPGPLFSASVLANAPERLRGTQLNFAHTGGVHAAAALDAHGEVLAAFEDVGRHNAVDKVVGALVLEHGLRSARTALKDSPRPALLVVSGRVGFDILQKAAVARIPIVASVSAATSLAIDLAGRAGITLATFVRGGRFNVYSHPERLRED